MARYATYPTKALQGAIPPQLSYYPDLVHQFFERQAYGKWQQNGDFVSGYQHNHGGIMHFKNFHNIAILFLLWTLHRPIT
jgi:hypothetical protein